ncbi:MAG TPA: DUF748 domain-containing protein [Candidatus Sulfotelmatobacter sp.]|nr:DUF748 domain-containing protein [Candidatus Sulfotelmatobacter sp.]
MLKTSRARLAVLVILLGLILAGAVGYRIAAGLLKGKVAAALGPGSEIQDLRVGWSGVEVVGLRIRGPQGWPAADSFRAERVRIRPRLRGLVTGSIQVGSITAVKPYLSMLRTRDGKLRVLPSLLERPARQGASVAAPVHQVRIGRVVLEDGVVELFDATAAEPPLKIRVEQIQASIRDLLVPELTPKSRLELAGVVKGVQHDGSIKVAGWIQMATKDSSITTELRGVDLVAFQPYLASRAETRVEKGTLDFDLASEVTRQRLRAPGKLVLSNLEFAPTQGALDTFMGVPRGAVVAFLRDRQNRIAINFTIEGDLANPRFSLNEAFTTRLASSLAEHLGLSLRGLAKGMGGLGRNGVEEAHSLGSALQRLFQDKKH